MRLRNANVLFGTKKIRLRITKRHCVAKIYDCTKANQHCEVKKPVRQQPINTIKSKNGFSFCKKREF
jgi:hypothetical protein